MKLDRDALILWFDEFLLVINKPAGLLALPDGYVSSAPHLKGVLPTKFSPVWIVHRLDRDTSGVLILARTEDAHRALNAQFATGKINKVYHALVVGNPPWNEITVKLPLLPDGDRKHRTVVDELHGKPSQTHIRVLDSFKRYTLVEAIPQTGRTHQIRVHLADLGFPIVADALYGGGDGIFLSQLKLSYRKGRTGERALLGRMGLHAWSLNFAHPLSGGKMGFEAPYPKDLRVSLRQLRKHRLLT